MFIDQKHILTTLLVLLPLLGLAIAIYQPVFLWWRLQSPLPATIVEVHTITGEVLYGRLAGASGGFVALRDVYFFEKYRAASPASQGLDTSTSQDFAVAGTTDAHKAEKVVLSKKQNELLVQKQAIVSMEIVTDTSTLFAQAGQR